MLGNVPGVDAEVDRVQVQEGLEDGLFSREVCLHPWAGPTGRLRAGAAPCNDVLPADLHVGTSWLPARSRGHCHRVSLAERLGHAERRPHRTRQVRASRDAPPSIACPGCRRTLRVDGCTTSRTSRSCCSRRSMSSATRLERCTCTRTVAWSGLTESVI